MRRLRMVPVLALVTACGGSTPPIGSNAPPTGSNTPAACRTYAAAFTTTATTSEPAGTYVSTEAYSCLFDREALVLRCTGIVSGGLCTTSTDSWTYTTLEDFVEEAQAVGRERWDTLESVGSGNCAGSTARQVHTYDAAMRPVRLHYETSGADPARGFGPFQIDTTFTAWDTLGRPTQDTWTDSEGCSAGTETRTYDDLVRTVVENGSDCSATPSVQTLTYDADGSLVNLLWTKGSSSYSRVSTISATATVCL
jgi:hypothetical protein